MVLGLLVVMFSLAHLTSQAASGDADLSLALNTTTIAPGQQTNATIMLDSSGLILSGAEEISTISVFLEFPADKLEALGPIDFTSSAFPTAYVGAIDNEEGTIEIVRARNPGQALPASATIGTITFRARSTATSGNATIAFTPGLNNILLNDPGNSDVVGNLNGKTISIAPFVTPTPTPTATPTASATATPPTVTPPPATATPSPSTAAGKAKIWVTASDPDIASGGSTTASVRLDTGGRNISSVDLIFTYPADELRINTGSIDISEGAFASVITNRVNANTGKIELTLFSDQTVNAANVLVGSFSLTRTSGNQSGIFLGGGSGVYLDDVQNTNVLSLADSFGIVFPAEDGPSVSASLSRSVIAANENVSLSIQSSKAGAFAVRKDSCQNYSVVAQGTITAANTPQTVSLSGSQIGVGTNQRLVVCVTDASAVTGSSPQLSISVTAASTPSGSTASITWCSVAPNPVIAGQLSGLGFVMDRTGTVTLHRDSCASPAIPVTYGGNSVTNIPVVTAAGDCAGAKTTVSVAANAVGSPGIYSLVLCNGSAASQATTLTITTSGSSGGGGGGGGGGGSSSGGGSQSTPAPSQAPLHSAAPDSPNSCQKPSDFAATPQADGNILFTWNKIDDARVTDLELRWGTRPGMLTKTIELPVIPTMRFPAEDLAVGMRYYFSLTTLGDCQANSSAETSVMIEKNGSMQADNPPASGSSGSHSQSSGGRRHAAANGNGSQPQYSYAQSNAPIGDGAWIAGGRNGDSSVGVGGEIGGTAGNGNNSAVSGTHYAALPPNAAGSGPVALALGLLILSGVGAFAFRKRKKNDMTVRKS